ncbi:MAG: diguanylate cyclase [Gammaproteobacteria bacterium]
MQGLLPKDDPIQALILKRFFMAFGSYATGVSFGIFSTLSGDGIMTPRVLAFVIAGVILSNLFFYLVIRTGRNKAFSDPSLTVPQLGASLFWMLALMLGDAQNRGVFLGLYMIIMMFGLFRFRFEQMAKLAVIAVAGYGLVILVDYTFLPERLDPSRELLRAGVLTAMLIWATLFAGYVSDLRDKLRRRNRDLSVALDEIGNLASRDDLTKAYNRRFIMDALKLEKSRADRTSSTFSICLLDLDHFKSVNDRYGHLAGDRVLMAFSERIKGTLRGMDLIDQVDVNRFFGRYGGEEFIVVLPDTELSGAIRCAERIRQVTEEASFDEVSRVTLSAGVSEYRRGDSIEDMLRRADTALYEAKGLGRNQVAADNQQAVENSDDESEKTITNIVIGPFGSHRS